MMAISALESAKRALSIRDVMLKGSVVESGDGVIIQDLIPSKDNYLQEFRGVQNVDFIELEADEDSSVFLYRFNYRVGIRLIAGSGDSEAKEEDLDVLVTIVTDFDACYHASSELSDEELKKYEENNVGYHVWPYWREYVQSTCQRLGLTPSIPVPVYILE